MGTDWALLHILVLQGTYSAVDYCIVEKDQLDYIEYINVDSISRHPSDHCQISVGIRCEVDLFKENTTKKCEDRKAHAPSLTCLKPKFVWARESDLIF
jgi:hypothetical protein